MWLHWPMVESLPCAGALHGEVVRYPWPVDDTDPRRQREIVEAREMLLSTLRLLKQPEHVYEWRRANGRISRLFVIPKWGDPLRGAGGLTGADTILAWERAHGFFYLQPPCNPVPPVVRTQRAGTHPLVVAMREAVKTRGSV